MATPSAAQSETSGDVMGPSAGDLDDFFGQLNLAEEEFDDLIIDEADPVINERVRWLALAKVHTEKTFSHAAFFKEMRAAWNPAQQVRSRAVGTNLFVVQASCLGDWERMMNQGPWIFRFWAVLMHPYDGISRTEDIQIVHMPIWLQIHKLPDGYCDKAIMEKLIKKAGKVLDIRLNGNSRGDYIRVRVKHDVREPLTKDVSIIRGKERQVLAVRYGKLARFCKACSKIGHDFKECGTGIHLANDMKYGDWLYADFSTRPRSETRSVPGSKGAGPESKPSSSAKNANGEEDDLKSTTSNPQRNAGMDLDMEAPKCGV